MTTTGMIEISVPGIILNDGAKYYVVVTYDGSNVFIYINAVLAISVPSVFIIDSQTDVFSIGNNFTPTIENAFNAVFDEIAIYNYTLTGGNILAHYTLGFMLPIVITDYQQRILSLSPIAYLRVGEDIGETIAVDEIGNVSAVYNGPVELNRAGAIFNDPSTSVELPDKNSWIQIQDPLVDFFDEYSLEAWINLNVINPNTGTDSQQTIFSKSPSPSIFSTEYLADLLGGNLRFVSNNNSINSPNTLNILEWYHVVFTRNGSVGNIYVNGILDVSGSLGAAIPATVTPLAIGHSIEYSPSLTSLMGRVDEIALYDRELTPLEISDNYSFGISIPPLPSAGGGLFASTVNIKR